MALEALLETTSDKAQGCNKVRSCDDIRSDDDARSRDLYARKIAQYDYVNTDGNPAELLTGTKGLPRGKHERFTRAKGIW